MIVSKEIIEQELKSDGSLKSRSSLTKEYTPEDLFRIYHGSVEDKCVICGNKTKFINFKRGYDIVCSRECRKEHLSNSFTPTHENILCRDELIGELIELYSSGDNANKLNIHFFVNNKKTQLINSLHYYGLDIKNLSIKDIYDFCYEEGRCKKCNNKTSFISFKEGYRAHCKTKCVKTNHILNEDDLTVQFVTERFVKDGLFLIDDMMKYFGVSGSFVNKFKESNGITISNKVSRYSYGERELYNEFKLSSLDFRTNCRNIINPYEIDFVIGNLCIEYDGLMFHSDGLGYPGNNGKRFKDKLIPPGYELLTIFENEFLDENKKKIWFSIIKNKLNLNKTRIYARKCEIRSVSTKDAKSFCEDNHIQGYAKSSIKIGLYYDGELVSIMTFSKPRFNKNIEYELIRFCSKKGTNVIGGGSKLLKEFERSYKPSSLISYANKRWSSGGVYEKLGFTYNGDTPNNYFYFKVNENILLTRNQCQKHKLNHLLANYDSSLTEESNMFNNGYRKIYDYGNKKYVKFYTYKKR